MVRDLLRFDLAPALPLPRTMEEFIEFHHAVTGVAHAEAVKAAEAAGMEVDAARPPIRLYFKHGIVIGSFADIHGKKKRAGWQRKLGPLESVAVVDPTDSIDGARQPYAYTGGPRVENFNRRAKLKKLMGRGFHSAVTQANRMSKKAYLEYFNAPHPTLKAKEKEDWNQERTRLWKRLTKVGFSGFEHFWRAVKGTAQIPEPKTLFSERTD